MIGLKKRNIKKMLKLGAKAGGVSFADVQTGLSTLFQTNFFRLFFRYCTGV